MKLLFISTKWCSHCDTCKKEIESNPIEGIEMEYMNPDEDLDLITIYSLRYIPAIVLVKDNGEMIKRYENFKWSEIKPELESLIEKNR